ncbi:MAG TPA: hypothetical protein VFQ53_15135 [Kofleriaceae bacterium]|nr:hypothetical protein [Kofleriaceae bacterium]
MQAFRVAAWLLVIGCGSSSPATPGDCELVLGKPADAMVALSKRYPGEPVKVAEIIERCIAPDGDECTRIAKIVQAIPSMMPTRMATAGADARATCRGMPPALRRCLMPSYGVAHLDECKRQLEDMAATPIDQIPITPSTVVQPDPDACEDLVLRLDRDGTWLRAGTTTRCFARYADGHVDRDWLARQLETARNACHPSISVVASDGIAYQALIDAMDVIVAIGYPDVGLAARDDARIFDGAKRSKDCAAPHKQTALPAPRTIPASGGGPDALQSAPVVIVTRDELMFSTGGDRRTLAKLSELGTGTLDALAAAFPKDPKHRLWILQADVATPATLVHRIVETAKTAGYDSVLFAVKNR